MGMVKKDTFLVMCPQLRFRMEFAFDPCIEPLRDVVVNALLFIAEGRYSFRNSLGRPGAHAKHEYNTVLGHAVGEHRKAFGFVSR
ncbi:hypothetical protein WK69_02540 [Burkholderia ubonensis]|nr:hypothetical protein WK69_02540 [Burkholderia ubonensis]